MNFDYVFGAGYAMLSGMSNFQPNLPNTPERTDAERKVDGVRSQGGIFVKAVAATRVPMIVTDATLPGNPVIFANDAFLRISGYAMDEILGQEPHFLDGPETSPAALQQFESAIAERRDETLEILQYRKDGSTLWATLFVSPWADEDGRIVHHFLSFLDVTRRRDAEDDLRQFARNLEQRVAERTQELTVANARLSRLLTENEVLLREVDHRAKNSLAIASSLLIAQAYQQADPAVRALFLDTQERLGAMAHAHDLLSKSGDPRRIGLAPYLRGLCASLMAASGKTADIRIEVQADDSIHILADHAIALGLIVNELVTNAMKHAFPPNRAGRIEVAARRSQAERVTLRVRDDGMGMSTGRDGALGYGIIRSLVEKISGEMEIGCDGGVAVTITFPA
ncbi:histidine kinase dimerization/phosphoacceptor domain -containing protein [Azospirillum canadense]|uniref:histidine kinase dimerization/phosphoacceptor domain -containing protein n=1 Tax=Azospirillum canadense TaxID=403962 RepID=UPI0022269142|nr:histidine kinase dimerization/phosphoacceptor domain -containing protein [Azospirillum canadense]MCW2239152.1 PAS domain S-box-containing protein [Azospirillum canadense]